MNLLTFVPKPGLGRDECIPVQEELTRLKFYGDTIDGDFGKNSTIALKGFQAAVRGDIVDVATSQIGVKETPMGSNRGPTVDLYLDAVGMKGQAEPWCAAFLSWCCQRWAENTPNAPKFKLPKSALAFAWEKLGKAIVGTQVFHPGDKFTLKRCDIIIYTFSHIGVFSHMGGDGMMYVVEGNTDYAGSRTGGQVMLHPRSKTSIKAVVRLPFTA